MTNVYQPLADNAIVKAERTRDFYSRYVGALNARRFDLWPGFFAVDGQYLVTSAENEAEGLPLAFVRCESRAMIEDRLYALQRATTYEPRRARRITSNLRMTEVARGWAVTLDFIVSEARLDSPLALFAAGHFDDVLVEEGADFRFLRHNCILDNDLIANSLILPL